MVHESLLSKGFRFSFYAISVTGARVRTQIPLLRSYEDVYSDPRRRASCMPGFIYIASGPANGFRSNCSVRGYDYVPQGATTNFASYGEERLFKNAREKRARDYRSPGRQGTSIYFSIAPLLHPLSEYDGTSCFLGWAAFRTASLILVRDIPCNPSSNAPVFSPCLWNF